ncbi:hypothetical protein PS3A_40420 [Pseudomonas sp. 3A(2025)]
MKRGQRGFNLISLMVGITLSLISVLAMLSLYKNMVGISVQSIQDSRQDGQIAAALLTAQQELRNAGFWITVTSTLDTRLKLLYNATLTNGTLSGTARTLSGTETSGNAMVWIYQTSSSATATCAGLLVQSGKLVRLQGASSCTTLAQWNSTTWTATTLIETNQPADFFKAVQVACWPFGKAVTPLSTTSLPLKVTITAATSVLDSTSTESAPVYVKSTSETCLPNLVTST